MINYLLVLFFQVVCSTADLSNLSNDLLDLSARYKELVNSDEFRKNFGNNMSETFYYTHEDIEAIIGNDNGSYDIDNRFILLNNFTKDDVKAYQLMSIKPLAKHDNGHYIHSLIILAYKDKLRLVDNYGNLFKEFKVDFVIEDIYSFINNEGNHSLYRCFILYSKK
jgi:hypothetical protein